MSDKVEAWLVEGLDFSGKVIAKSVTTNWGEAVKTAQCFIEHYPHVSVAPLVRRGAV